jgi:zinc transport system ATP-binding protein
MANIVEIRGLSFSYRNQPVLEDIDLGVEEGTTLGLIGPNGGGKTTLVRLMLGALQPSRGVIRVAGLDPRAAVRRGDVIGYLPQNSMVPANLPLSVRQFVRLGLAGRNGMLQRSSAQQLQFVEEMLERIGAGELADRAVGDLSGGQLQRVHIARALAPKPRILLMDEPTTGIDRAGQQKFIDSIATLKRELGLTVVFVSHDLRAVASISDRIACLNCRLHYHDVPQRLPSDLVYQMFACDLEAMGIVPHEHVHVGQSCNGGGCHGHPASG